MKQSVTVTTVPITGSRERRYNSVRFSVWAGLSMGKRRTERNLKPPSGAGLHMNPTSHSHARGAMHMHEQSDERERAGQHRCGRVTLPSQLRFGASVGPHFWPIWRRAFGGEGFELGG